MKVTKLHLLKATLVLGALFFLVGAAVHWFGLSLFPWYDHALYSPYHDSLIAAFCLFLVLLLLTLARGPVKNKDVLRAVIIGVLLISLFNVLIPFKIDFVSLGAPAKKMQTILEGVLGFVYGGILLLLSY